MTSAALLATVVALVVGGGHWMAHRVFGDEVYFSKSGVSKAGVVVTGLAWFATYLIAGGGLAALLGPLAMLVDRVLDALPLLFSPWGALRELIGAPAELIERGMFVTGESVAEGPW